MYIIILKDLKVNVRNLLKMDVVLHIGQNTHQKLVSILRVIVVAIRKYLIQYLFSKLIIKFLIFSLFIKYILNYICHSEICGDTITGRGYQILLKEFFHSHIVVQVPRKHPLNQCFIMDSRVFNSFQIIIILTNLTI